MSFRILIEIGKIAEHTIKTQHRKALNQKETSQLLNITHHTLYSIRRPDYILSIDILQVINFEGRCGECMYFLETVKALQTHPEVLKASQRLKASRAKRQQLENIRYIIS